MLQIPHPPPPKLECFSMRVDNFTGWIHQLYTYSPENSKTQSENLEEAKNNKYLRNFSVTQPVTSQRLWNLSNSDEIPFLNFCSEFWIFLY